MNILRKAVTTLGGVFLAALLITALAPRAVRGITATIVEVTNTSANPVPTVSADANFPYEALICVGEECPLPSPGAATFTVPTTTTTGVPVKRLVIEDVDATNCELMDGAVFVGLVQPPSADNNGLSGFGEMQSFFFAKQRATVRIYANPGATAFVNAASTFGLCEVVFSGHLETK